MTSIVARAHPRLRLPPDPPLVMGGQGRTERDMIDYTKAAVWLCVLAFCLGTYFLAGKMLGLL